MISIFNKTKNQEALIETIKKSKVCKGSINQLQFNDKGLAWLNPNNQTCFNSGWFNEQDFLDWLDGKGKIVKGNDDEKKIYWEYAIFQSEYEHSYMITSNHKYFYLVSDEYKNEHKYDFKPYEFNLEKSEEIISNIFGNFLSTIVSELGYMDYNRVYFNYKETAWGIKRTLSLLGIGYTTGACNTPETIMNLNWFSDIVFAKAYYIHLKNKGVCFPNFDFIDNNH